MQIGGSETSQTITKHNLNSFLIPPLVVVLRLRRRLLKSSTGLLLPVDMLNKLHFQSCCVSLENSQEQQYARHSFQHRVQSKSWKQLGKIVPHFDGGDTSHEERGSNLFTQQQSDTPAFLQGLTADRAASRAKPTCILAEETLRLGASSEQQQTWRKFTF